MAAPASGESASAPRVLDVTFCGDFAIGSDVRVREVFSHHFSCVVSFPSKIELSRLPLPSILFVLPRT
jgi:hypothetical protein